MLLTRYYSPQFVLDLSLDTGIEMISKAAVEHRKERLWDMWIARYAKMNRDNFISFDDFMKQATATPATASTKTAQEILDDAEWIQHALREAHLKGG
ncbi:hypothetical protein [Paenibacillus radicis (ex Xue et al. 2023)]|uniref:Uncharacterized protein n=1 Tax=Paenibacillus radicis (ex Xue et al. 2023) TaxID=2972489 RepID=A0ABT1YUE8_9BACL|nr:hypothetical protein [Paenibacillus radicis (ex Xue et al. 2023)]MCR8635745.1 hypothetical protein [Paenibacillus radicis (ex Xue et al. 2023)]